MLIPRSAIGLLGLIAIWLTATFGCGSSTGVLMPSVSKDSSDDFFDKPAGDQAPEANQPGPPPKQVRYLHNRRDIDLPLWNART